MKRDEYAHDNTFSNIYLHDVQQDGGDDGGLFTVFVYYSHHNFSRPNVYDQIVIDEVGAQPNMSDIAPNNINLDMGWCGIAMSNIKTVNPQHYTIENSHLRDGEVKVDNCTFDFANGSDGIDHFDDSKMDYANIGIQTWKYPAAYQSAVTVTEEERPEEIWFEEDFENGIDQSVWTCAGSPEITKSHMSEGAFNGKASLKLNNTGSVKPYIYKEFEQNLNKTVSVKIFDRQLSPGTTYSGEGRLLPDTGRTVVRVDDGTEENLISLGIDPDVSPDYYVLNIGGRKTATEVRRVFGWHELTFDYSEAGMVTLYVDGVKAGTAERNGFHYVALGSSDGTGENYYDELYIYGGRDVEAGAAEISESSRMAAGENGYSADISGAEAAGLNESETLIDWKFEDSTDVPYNKDETYHTPFTQVISGGGTYSGTLSGNTMLGYFNASFNIVDNPQTDGMNFSEKVLGRSGEGGCHAYAQQGTWWKNYMLDFDYLYKSSDPGGKKKDNSVSFILYSQNANDNLSSGAPYQPNGYWFAVNEATGALELRKGENGKGLTGNTLLDKEEIDTDEFNKMWHNIKVYAKNGNGYTDIVVSVDNGEYTLNYRDVSNPFTEGTIAVNSMGTDFYLDNISVTTIPDGPLAGYDKNFRFGNAVLDKAFDVNTYDYTATITDSAKEVTLVKPVFEGAEYTVELNGTDITGGFPDDQTSAVLELKPGNNTVVVTEYTDQGVSTAYVFAIYKESSLTESDLPKEVDITVGTMPQFPKTAELTVTDGLHEYQIMSEVNWEMADQSYYKTPGSFVIRGTLTELKDEPVSVKVNVDGVISVGQPEKVKGKAGEDPFGLLAESIDVTYAHSGTKAVPVQFKTFEKSVYAGEGTIAAVGTVEGCDSDIIQLIQLEEAGEVPAEPVDKTLLQKTYDYAETLSTDGVVDSAKKFFEDAKAAAAVLADENATQEQINAAWDNLLEGIWGLGLVQGDKTTLELLIGRADDMTQNADKYVAGNWQMLADALAEAKTVYDDGDALEGDVQTAADALLDAILAQRYQADKSNLADLIAKAEGIDTAKYTEESVQVFRAAFASAKAVMMNDSLSIEDQTQVDEAANALQTAIEGLEPISSTDDGKDVPKTGDNTPMGLMMALICAAAGTAVAVKRRKRSR